MSSKTKKTIHKHSEAMKRLKDSPEYEKTKRLNKEIYKLFKEMINPKEK